MKGYYKQVVAILEQNKFLCLRQKGSHQTWGKGSINVTVSTNCYSRHTANEIMKQAGIKHHFD